MQWYLTTHSYTCMGLVTTTAVLRTDTPEGTTAKVLEFSTHVPDDGESDPLEWCRGALIGLLESL